ncbi:uncharacterized protein PHALS_06410 [Plasmopara halstedii]|uniref:Uncharacterized protein n=1 Tax=Plasmopara halstedii TaxID=4781 RepID=A0A0N7L813_PLAHL|nr:uncharacterized protein PHALS_06410 [Plasmopara halstedii]CEG48595.1 hypothetical protein PHALS_06410 [Plasmopara halstedii]|eukprot:XP_024584964.1 hypothetical protein PHALS_06410 [Plasmopara halstedii]
MLLEIQRSKVLVFSRKSASQSLPIKTPRQLVRLQNVCVVDAHYALNSRSIDDLLVLDTDLRDYPAL